MYISVRVDGEDILFKVGEVKIPSQLYVKEAMEVNNGAETDRNEEDLTVQEYFKDGQKKYVFVEAKGTIPGTWPSTTHEMVVSLSQTNEPYTKEELEADYEGWTVTEISEDGVSGFLVRPDTEASETGFASELFFLNAGSYELEYTTIYLGMEVSYQGGLTDYAEVNFDELTAVLQELVTVDFAKTE